jgi:hypothetical protein
MKRWLGHSARCLVIGLTVLGCGEGDVVTATAGGAPTGNGGRGGGLAGTAGVGGVTALGGIAGQAGAPGGSAGAGGIAPGGGGAMAGGGAATGGGMSTAGGGTTSTGGTAMAGGGTATGGGTSTAGGGITSTGGTAMAGGGTATGGVGGSAGGSGMPQSGGTTTTGGAAGSGGTTGGAGGNTTTGGAANTGGAGGGGSPLGGTAGVAGSAGAPACTLVPQSGCPGGACDLGSGGTACRTVTTPGTEASTCATMNDCAAGYLCTGSCMRYCETDGQCDAPGGLCVISIYSGGVLVPGVTVCSQNCDPLTAQSCPTGWGCGVYRTADARSFSACHTVGAGTQGSTCTYDADCSPGYGCITITNAGTGDAGPTTTQSCLAYCVSSPTPTACPGTTTCRQFSTPAVMGTSTYGICL